MQDQRRSKNQLKIRLHYFLAIIYFLHSVFYLVYWYAVGDFKNDVDQFIGDAVGLNLPFITILMWITALFGIWSLIRFISFHLAFKKQEWTPDFSNWIYFGVGVLFLTVFYVAFVIILRENPSQRGVLFHLLNIIRLATDALFLLFVAVWLRRLILDLRSRMLKSETQWPWVVGIVLSLLSLVGLWLVPAIFPPNWAYRGDLPAKPALIAHRGASMLAPENTLAAAELAGDHQALGFETDIRISIEGVPFLMHDETLARTTNIEEVYPERVSERASTFSMDELKTLNAGSWFIHKDLNNKLDEGLVSQNQLGINRSQKIPTLGEALEVVETQDLVFLFDLLYPPQDHPYYDEFFEIVLTQCKESGLNNDIWFLLNREQLEIVEESAPQMTRVAGVSSTDLPDANTTMALGYEIINVDSGILTKDIHTFREQGLGVNVYTIDEPWLFSHFWLSGVTSVTTNNVHTFNELDQPTLNLSYSRYLLYWGLFGIIVAIWLAVSPIVHEKKSTSPRQFTTPDLMDFKMEEDEVSESRGLAEGDQAVVDKGDHDQEMDDNEGQQL